MDYVRYLRERALEFRNLAITTPDAGACQELHHLADLCEGKAAILSSREKPLARPARAEKAVRTKLTLPAAR